MRALTEKRGWAFGLGVVVLKPLLVAISDRTWIDGEKIPPTGGCLVVFNHISHLDPLTAAHMVYDHGRVPRFLAKSSLFTNRVLGGFLKSAGQIPVERLSRNAVGAYDAAVRGVRDGHCVVVYPEGTLTRDPGLWPMTGKTGAARIALETGCPVIPVGQWGVNELLAPYAKLPDLFPRKDVSMRVGNPVDLDDLRGLPRTAENLAEATERIMTAITEQVAILRDETPPAVRFDARKAGVKLTGNPNKPDKR
ncbi:MAG: lysophospholipid acyltransferase family protein [Nocardioides sp.]